MLAWYSAGVVTTAGNGVADVLDMAPNYHHELQA
jgi:hypothetical protein